MLELYRKCCPMWGSILLSLGYIYIHTLLISSQNPLGVISSTRNLCGWWGLCWSFIYTHWAHSTHSARQAVLGSHHQPVSHAHWGWALAQWILTSGSPRRVTEHVTTYSQPGTCYILFKYILMPIVHQVLSYCSMSRNNEVTWTTGGEARQRRILLSERTALSEEETQSG